MNSAVIISLATVVPNNSPLAVGGVTVGDGRAVVGRAIEKRDIIIIMGADISPFTKFKHAKIYSTS